MVKDGDQSGTGLQGSDNLGDSSETEKQQLRKEIRELQSYISRLDRHPGNIKFGDVIKKIEIPSPFVLDGRAIGKVQDINVLFQKQIHEYIGFYCTKVNKTKYVFNYKPYDKIGPNETYSVEICNKDGKVTMGRWVMPMCIDINTILSETEVNELSSFIPFFKNWMRYIDCYTERKSQYHELKNRISNLSNCTVDVAVSYDWITLHLYGMYDKAKDRYANLTIYLLYKLNETRPYKISTEWSLKKCSPDEENELKAYTKCLKNHSLSEGFGLMVKTANPVFSWTTETHGDRPLDLELSNTSDSDKEGILELVKVNRDKSTRKRRKGRDSKQQSKRTKGKKKAERSQPRVSKDEDKGVNLSNETTLNTSKLALEIQKNSMVDEIHKIPNTNDIKSSELDDTVDKFVKKYTRGKKPMPLVGILSAQKKGTRKMNRAITSTPLGKKVRSKVNFALTSYVEISPIVSADDKN